MKYINIIGGGLYGCLSAYHIAKKHPDLKIRIFEKQDCLISAFDSIQLGKHYLNNGFHGLEIPRSKPLFDFFNNELSLDMLKSINKRGLFIKDKLVSYNDGISQWPEDYKKHFNIDSKYDIENGIKDVVSSEYINLLKQIGTRYSDEFEDIKHLLIPWFLPKEFVSESDDEGDIFRNKVRTGEIISEYGYHSSGLFQPIQDEIKKLLLSMNVDIHFKSKFSVNEKSISVKFEDDTQNEISLENSTVIYCTSIVGILKSINPTLFGKLLANKRFFANALYKTKKDLNKNYSEVLSATLNATSIGRVSSPVNRIDNSNLIQVELFFKDMAKFGSTQDEIKNVLAKIYDLKSDDIELIEIKQTRTVFFPPNEISAQATKEISLWQKKISDKYNISIRNNIGPINMAKAWLWSIENSNSIN